MKRRLISAGRQFVLAACLLGAVACGTSEEQATDAASLATDAADAASLATDAADAASLATDVASYCPLEAVECPAGCAEIRASPYDADRDCIEPPTPVGCTFTDHADDETVCIRREPDGALYLSVDGRARELMAGSEDWSECTPEENEATLRASACDDAGASAGQISRAPRGREDADIR
jgi:hypothetical protein